VTPRTARPGLRGLRTLLVLLLLFLAVWMPRVQGLDRFVTPDEPTWLYRSANFYRAISSGDFAGTFQREHPGVTVMWAGTLAFLQKLPRYAEEGPLQLGEGELEPWLRDHNVVEPLQLLVAARWWMVLWIALITVAAYFPLRRLFGAPIATLAVLVVAWDPFLIALSRLLHLDGLLASLTLLALLSFLAWLHCGQQLRYFSVSVLATGLALLTKTPAVILIPAAGLLVLVEWFRRVRAGEGKSPGMLLGLLAWMAFAIATVVGLWPAMWVDPLNVLASIAAGMRVHAAGHDSLNFFLGRTTEDPGPLFYPVVYLFRSTPAALIGLVVAAVLGWRRQWPLEAPPRRRSVLGLVIFAVLFAFAMMLGAKKFDRYISPVFIAVDIVATLGLLGLVQAVLGWWQRWRSSTLPGEAAPSPSNLGRISVWIVVAALLLFHGLLAFVHYPYYFTYYNPLAGGSRTAPDVLLLGWGEGLDAAAGWLKQQPEAAHQRVISWYSDGPLSYFVQPGQKALSFYFTSYLLDADYAVLYVNQWQRGLPSPELVNYFLAQKPVHIVRSGGLELARIYDIRNQPPPDFVHIDTSRAADFGDRMRLAAYRFEKQTLSPGDNAAVTLYLKKLADVGVAYNLLLRLVAPDGREVWREEGWPAGEPTTGWPVDEMRYDDHQINIPDNVAPGRYKLMLSFYDPNTAELLPLGGGAISQEVASIEVQAPGAKVQPASPPASGNVEQSEAKDTVTPRMRAVEVSASWGDVRLTGLQHAQTLSPGQTLRVELSAEGRVDGTHKLSTRLVDPSGAVKAQNDQRLGSRTRLDLELPADAKPGPYTLTVVVYDPDTLAPFPDSGGNFMTTLSGVEVLGNAAP
jgi:4-amino-4-deoxy-L-arabinose transferase-like glycosyltransferase